MELIMSTQGHIWREAAALASLCEFDCKISSLCGVAVQDFFKIISNYKINLIIENNA